jgi:hypothetical protein
VAQQVLQQHLESERQVVHAQPVQTVQPPPAIAKHHRITDLQAVPQWWVPSFSSTAAVLARSETSG